MKRRRARSDDVLFISAVAAVLLGVGLLLHTTDAYPSAIRVWPIAVLAGGGIMLYLALVRGFSAYFFFGSILLLLAGILIIVGGLAGWSLRESWPLGMAAAGAAWFLSGLIRARRVRASFAFPSAGFALLGLFFSLFSFHVLPFSFGRFVGEWWPSLIIAGGVSLFVAYGASVKKRPADGQAPEPRSRPRPGRPRRPAGSAEGRPAPRGGERGPGGRDPGT